jgi:hypothetical protein
MLYKAPVQGNNAKKKYFLTFYILNFQYFDRFA